MKLYSRLEFDSLDKNVNESEYYNINENSYVFHYKLSKDGEPMVFSGDYKIGGMINEVGTMVLSFNTKSLIDNFKSYCDKNEIQYGKFLGSEDILTVNQKYFKVEGLPKEFPK